MVVLAPITLAGGLTFSGTTYATQTAGSIVSGTGPLTVNTSNLHIDSGSVALSGANTFTGDILLQSGVLRVLTGATPLGAATNVLKPSGGVLQGTLLTLPNPVDTASANLLATSSGGSLTLSGVVSGANGIVSTQRGGSSLILTNDNAYTGQTINRLIAVDTSNGPSAAGPLVFQGAGSALASSGFVSSGGGRLVLDNSTVAASIPRIGSAAPVTPNNGVFQVNGSTNTSATPFVQSAGVLTGTGMSMVSLNSQAATTEGVAV